MHADLQYKYCVGRLKNALCRLINIFNHRHFGDLMIHIAKWSQRAAWFGAETCTISGVAIIAKKLDFAEG